VGEGECPGAASIKSRAPAAAVAPERVAPSVTARSRSLRAPVVQDASRRVVRPSPGR